MLRRRETERLNLGPVNKQDLHIDTWPNNVVPVTVEGLRSKVERRHLRIRDLTADGIATPVEATGDGQTFRGRRVRNQSNDSLVVAQRFPTPVRGNGSIRISQR